MDISEFLSDSRNFKAKPIFCLASEKAETEKVVKLLYQRGKADEEELSLPKIYALEDLFYYIERSIRRNLANLKALREEEKDHFLKSSEAALQKLQSSTFIEVPTCAFHEEFCRVEYCCLSTVRNRAFTMLDRLCDVRKSYLFYAFFLIVHTKTSLKLILDL